MSQRVALITGGARRVGRAIVKRLHAAGFAVVFTYHGSKAEADSLVGDTGALAVNVDLTDSARGVETIYQEFISRFSSLDLLVNNASIYKGGDAASAAMMAIHYHTPLLLCRRFETLLRQARGHVVNMVDLSVERPVPGYLPYGASKAALWHLTLGMARELAPEVTVNGIAPGVVEWPADLPEEKREQYLRRVPLARAGSPEEVGETVLFLATTGSYLTGQVLRLDGGRSIT